MKHLYKAALLLTLAPAAFTAAHAMDPAERARQMEIYNAHTTTGVAVVTKETALPAATAQAEAPAKAITEAAAETFAAGRKSDQGRQLEAYKAWQEGQQPAAVAQPATQRTAQATLPPVAVPPVTTDTSTIVAQNDGAQNNTASDAPQLVGEAVTTHTTTEKTTATNYTVTTRKVGLVGGRPYSPRTKELAGGVTRETIVDGVSSTQVVAPDTVAPLKNQPAEGDYYSSEPGAKVYARGDASNVRIHKTGRFN